MLHLRGPTIQGAAVDAVSPQALERGTPKAQEAICLRLIDEPIALTVGNAEAGQNLACGGKGEAGSHDVGPHLEGLAEMSEEIRFGSTWVRVWRDDAACRLIRECGMEHGRCFFATEHDWRSSNGA